ncbi:Ankyrin repeat-containing domain [Phytophthora cactorum]|nr:Ankyrin repeat-containing domain [Phytophthora cactorum]
MGQVCSGSGVSKHVYVPRDPADKELDPILIRKTKIADFDAFFESAAAPLNELVEIHNGIAESEENLKSAAAALQGETQVRFTVGHGGRAALVLWKFDKKDQVHVLTPEERDEKLSFSEDLRAAFDTSENTITNLNTALEKPPTDEPVCEYAEKHGRLFVTKRGQLDVLVRDVNVAVFTLLEHCNQREGGIKIMNGEEEMDLRKIKKLRAPVAQLVDAMVELIDNVETAVTSVPELAESSAAFVEESKGLPAKIPEAVSSSGLGISEMPKAATATTSNVKALSNGPKIARATTVMVQYAATELVQAAGIPWDHAGIAKLLLRKKAFIDETDSDGWSALHYGSTLQFVPAFVSLVTSTAPPAAANDAALAAEVLVQYDINLKARTESTKETALEMAERLRSHLVAILLYEVTYRKH